MHGTLADADRYVKTVLPHLPLPSGKRVLFAVPFTVLSRMAEWCSGSSLELGVQNIFDQDAGAFTGEISASMAHDAGARFSLIGHSERRKIFQETDEWIHRKVVRALSCLQPIICVGETLEDRDQGKAKEVVRRQIIGALNGLSLNEVHRVVLAYEPVWAIGTGMHATPEIAQEMHKHSRDVLSELFSEQIANHISILYGGSVKTDNMASFMKQDSIDGVLVGGASLDPSNFIQMIRHI
jgi:triosephosphate isomerase